MERAHQQHCEHAESLAKACLRETERELKLEAAQAHQEVQLLRSELAQESQRRAQQRIVLQKSHAALEEMRAELQWLVAEKKQLEATVALHGDITRSSSPAPNLCRSRDFTPG